MAANIKAVRQRKTTGAAKPLIAPENVGTAPLSTRSKGINTPLTAVGMASDNQITAAQIIVAIAALPAADKPSGSDGQNKIAKKPIQATAKTAPARGDASLQLAG